MSKLLFQKIRNLPSKVCWLSFSKGCVETWLGTWSLEGRRSLSYYSGLWRKSVHTAWPGLCPLWHSGSRRPKIRQKLVISRVFFQVSANSHNFRFVQYCCRHEYDLSISRIFWISFLAGFLTFGPTVRCGHATTDGLCNSLCTGLWSTNLPFDKIFWC